MATSLTLAIFASGLPSFVLIKVFSPAYFARNDTKTLMLYAGISLTANTMGSIGLFFLFRAQGVLPQLGIALATTIGGWINTFLLWRTLVTRDQFVADRRLKRALPIIVLASAVMGLMLFLIEQYLHSELLVDQSVLKRAAGLTILVVSGFASYVSAVTGVGLMRTSAANVNWCYDGNDQVACRQRDQARRAAGRSSSTSGDATPMNYILAGW